MGVGAGAAVAGGGGARAAIGASSFASLRATSRFSSTNPRRLVGLVCATATFVTGRGCADDVEFDGHQIREGSLVLYSPWVTQRLEHLWPDATSFRPERWDTEPLPYSFVPFGGGYRR